MIGAVCTVITIPPCVETSATPNHVREGVRLGLYNLYILVCDRSVRYLHAWIPELHRIARCEWGKRSRTCRPRGLHTPRGLTGNPPPSHT